MSPSDQTQSQEGLSLEARIEALMFVSSLPVTPGQLANALEVPDRQIDEALASLESSLAPRGIRLLRHGRDLLLSTAPDAAADVERFLNLESTAHLSRAALEVLAIAAYQQSITRPQIDAVRGVNSDSVLRTLLRYGLLEEAGRSEGPGRPILYSTTPAFLQHFGLASLAALPPLPQEEANKPDQLDLDLDGDLMASEEDV
ncbi:MAG: SMC-Scp complex subunit ScpB [Chloroflexi bacterium RBG_19FT_COMBO_62_14]|nr:MAG: SMC-Scp complex subunit ScpB [Chloroflexi bacterium RBG_19FT_COMBO_62_14]